LLSSAEEAKSVYERLKERCKSVIKNLSPENVFVVPCSVAKNVNIVGGADVMAWQAKQVKPPDAACQALVSWYTGPSVLGAIVKVSTEVSELFTPPHPPHPHTTSTPQTHRATPPTTQQ